MGELFTFIDDTKEAALTADILPGKRAIDLKFKQHGSFFWRDLLFYLYQVVVR